MPYIAEVPGAHTAPGGMHSISSPQFDLTFEGNLGRETPPLKILEWDPIELGSLKRRLGRAEDGRRYVLLSNQAIKRLGAAVNELLSYSLANACAVPVPPHGIFTGDGEVLFGSRYACGKLQPTEFQQLAAKSNGTLALRKQLSAIYAFDQLLGNTDRSNNNLLYTREDDQVTTDAIDFSEAGIFGEEWLSSNLLRENCTSIHAFNALFSQYGFDRDSAERVVNRVLHLRSDFIKQCLQSLPFNWTRDSEAAARWLSWWDSARFRRVEALFARIRTQ